MNLPSNLLWICNPCHLTVERYRTEAVERGLIVPRGIAEQHGGSGPIRIRDMAERSWWLTTDGQKIRWHNRLTPTPGGLL